MVLARDDPCAGWSLLGFRWRLMARDAVRGGVGNAKIEGFQE